MSYGQLANVQNQAGAPQVPRLMALGERLGKSLSELQDLNQRLDSVADRALGSIPTAVGKTMDQASPSTTVAQLETYLTDLESMLTKLRNTTDRLSSL